MNTRGSSELGNLKLKERVERSRELDICSIIVLGADFYALASDAMTCAINAKVKELESLPSDELQKYKAGLETVTIEVGEEHFDEALAKLVPSVSLEELQRYKEVRDKFQKNAH